jgi:hypothetical protein
MKRHVLIALLIAALAFGVTQPAASYLSNYTASGSSAFPDKWAAPPLWNLNPARNANITGPRDLGEVMQTSFNTWAGAPGTTISAARGGDSAKTSAGFDGVNLICFVCQGDFSQEAETLAVTITTTATQTGASDGRGGRTQFVGQILDSDILFNPSRSFNTDGAGGEDLQTVAVHEIGHFFGMNHSGVVRAVMFPFAPAVLRTLSYDDAIGIAMKYPAAGSTGGTIAGVVRLNGTPVFGAHVFAESLTGADPWGALGIRRSPISTLTFPDGSYRIDGLPGDSYSVTAEPLDLPVVNKDVSDFGGAQGGRSVQTNFTTRWY